MLINEQVPATAARVSWVDAAECNCRPIYSASADNYVRGCAHCGMVGCFTGDSIHRDNCVASCSFLRGGWHWGHNGAGFWTTFSHTRGCYEFDEPLYTPDARRAVLRDLKREQRRRARQRERILVSHVILCHTGRVVVVP